MNQFIEGNENYTAQGNDSKVVQGNNNHVDSSTEKIDVTINVTKQSTVSHSKVNSDNQSNDYSETRSLELEKEETEIHFFISGTLKNKKSKVTLKEFEKHLQKIANDLLLTIDDVEEGSLKFILKGSPEGLEQLERLFNAGELTEVFGVPVENIDFVESNREKLALTIAGDISQTDLAKLKATVTGVDEKELLIKTIKANRGLKILNLRSADLSGVDFSTIDLANFRLRFRRTNLNDSLPAYLRKANLWGADLSKANLSRANLSEANLSRANLSEADLSYADLSKVHFSYANLRGADLREANLREANLRGADLMHAKFSSDSLGMTEELKQDLISRGAIFEDSLEDPLVLTPVKK